MSKYQQRFTPLLPLIQNTLKQYKNKKELQRVIFDQKLKLAIIQKTPNVCLADFKNSIQANLSRKQTFSSHPFNRQRSNYYTVLEKSWISLNASLKHLGQAKDFPSPYEPCFHFKNNYQEYLDERRTLTYRSECESITIYSWALKIVNISNTGYYCIVLQALDYQRKGEKFVENIGNISSIIYQPQIQRKMQAFRLIDLRSTYKQAKDEKAPYSLFYYCREETPQAQLKRRPNNIFVVDKDQNLLKYDSEKQYKLISFGSFSGISTLQFPIKTQELNNQKIQAIHSQNLEIFFNYKVKQIQKAKEKKSNRPQLWSSSSQSEGSYHSDNQKSPQNRQGEDEESNESTDDPLRDLYLKQFEKMKIQ